MQIIDAIRNSIVDVFDSLNGGTLVFHTSAHAVVASCALSATAFGAPSAGVITANAISDGTVSTGGTVAHAHLVTSGSTEQCTLTCGTSGAEIILSGLTFSSGDKITVSSLTITMPAG
jgi:hypothetical protein